MGTKGSAGPISSIFSITPYYLSGKDAHLISFPKVHRAQIYHYFRYKVNYRHRICCHIWAANFEPIHMQACCIILNVKFSFERNRWLYTCISVHQFSHRIMEGQKLNFPQVWLI